MYIDVGSSLDHNFESFQYTNYSTCDYDKDLDPVNNLYNRVLPSCKYYDDLQFNVSTKNNSNGLSIIHFNARSLNANFHSIIHTLQTLNITFDIIAISETWTESNVTTEYDLPHYQVFHKARHYKKGGGVALYVNDRIDCTLIESKSVVVENMFKCVTVELNMRKMKNLIVSCMYRTPGANVGAFCESLDNILSDIKSKKTMYICGDFNIDILKHNTHNYTRTFLDDMYSFGLYPLITKPSRITDITATLIDNIFTNELQFQVNSGLLITDISDHLPVFAICGNQFVCRCATPSQYRRIINTSTTDKLIAELNQRTWPNVIGTLDVNLSYNNFVCEFQDLLNKHCPVKRVNNTENRYANNPWLTNGLKMHAKRKIGYTKCSCRVGH
ncbi:hypothetical protein NP493_317g00007 [Ridgeia piscesae]|uniref:Endonuclease/exonuclease/phosphatase domain-containing protein n=1 Tax=Ridgeia piscesae TaxID=27915 RepID=A0AAD9L4V2_RIDPI|nr:hypothetical protein NP493_317g00007 [Ridgeia piscesae]